MDYEVNDKLIEQLKKTEQHVIAWRQKYDELEEWRSEKDTRDAANQKALNDLAKRANAVPIFDANYNGLKGQIKMVISEHTRDLMDVRKDHSANFKFKDITLGSSLTGDAMRSYLDPTHKPGQGGINFRDLIRMVPTATGLVTLPRHTSTTGSFSRVGEGVLKPEIDKSITMVDFRAQYIAGVVDFSRDITQDLPFFQQWLSEELMIDFDKAENAQLLVDLSAVATGTPGAAGANYAETLINNIAALGKAGFVPNGVVSTYENWAALMQTKAGASTAYGAPGVITTDAQGATRVSGVPFFPASWMPTGKTLYGGWDHAQLAVVDTLQLQFFEVDPKHNMITGRLERREVLVIRDPAAFIYQ